MLTLATVATEIHARWREKGRKLTHLRRDTRAEAAGGGEAGVLSLIASGWLVSQVMSALLSA